MDPQHTPIRWGIAATGKIAGQFANAFSELDDQSQLVAVGSRRADTAQQFAETHAIPTAHASYQALADDPNVDVVYIASLQPGHVGDALTFLNAGKHVLVEKPMALSAAEVDQMIDAAQRHDRFLMEAMWMRFNPGPVEAVRMLNEGAIGPLRNLAIDFTISVPDDPRHRLRSLDHGGGALLDLGIYPLTLAWWLLGEPTTMTVDGTVERGVDTQCTINARWGDTTATLTAGLNSTGPLSARIEGDQGVLTIEVPFHSASQITLTGPDDDQQRIDTAPGSLHFQAAEVNRCLRAGERQSSRNPWATSRAILAACDTIRAELGVRYPTER